MPAMGGRVDETQFACGKRDLESRKNRRQDDDRGRSDKRAGDEEFLAKRTMGRVFAQRRLAVSGSAQNRTVASCRQGEGNVNMSLGEVTLLGEGGDRENKQQTPPQAIPAATNARQPGEPQHR